ncbi:MAG: ankyrin repeat domain-containing protein [Gammaproteobacteria bacterium]|nr:ankyrin repeat domain-containing protein [Gammaproteobacteria bacterium]
MKPSSRYASIGMFLLASAGLTIFLTLVDPGFDKQCVVEKIKNYADEKLRSWSCLHFAAASGNTDRMRAMLGNGAALEARSIEGKTPLYEAAKRGQTMAVELLRENGADLNAKSYHPGFAPLHVAAEYNHHDTVDYLLTQGADIEIENKWQQTPLSQASWRFADTELIALLLDRGAKIDTRDNFGFTPLHRAAGKQRLAVMRYLISRKADIDIKTDKGSTPLMFAARKGKIKSVELLLQSGARVEKRAGRRSALRYAQKEGHQQVVSLLRQYGAVDTIEISKKLKSGFEHYEKGELSESLAELNKSLDEDPKNAQALYYRGRTYQKMDKLDLALRDLLDSVELEPDNAAALEVIGWIYLTKQNHSESIRYYSMLLQQEPDNAKAYHNRAGLYARLGDMARARADVGIACEKGYADACRMQKKLQN